MRVLEVTAENFEDLLAYDDVLLDYFNAFLALPVFSRPLYYNRLTGTFEDLLNADDSYGEEQILCSSPLYGATDEEREKMMDWAKNERLPVFFRSHLFREYKLCRLLLRPLLDRPSASHGSGVTLRGYSRQTADSCVSSLSREASNAKEAEFSENGGAWAGSGSALFPYKRPGSRAVSLPIYAGIGRASKRSISSRRVDEFGQNVKDEGPVFENEDHIHTQPVINDAAITDPCFVHAYNSEEKVVLPHAEDSSTETRETEAHPSAGDMRSKSHLEAAYKDGNEYLFLPDEFTIDELTEEGIKDLESRHKMTLQEMKELLLGSVQSMENFRHFLQDTIGKCWYEFWLDCEYFKDTVEDLRDDNDASVCNHLFRFIQDKYRQVLSIDTNHHFARSANTNGLSPSALIQSQYNALRRLRVYWITRYIIHKERIGEFQISQNPELDEFEGLGMLNSRRSSEYSMIFPSVSLVKSLPIIPDKEYDVPKSNVDQRASSKREDHVKKSTSLIIQQQSDSSLERLLRLKFLTALKLEKRAGGPFQYFLQRDKNYQLLFSLQFWQDVEEFSHVDRSSADRYVHLVHGWDIFNRYLSADSEFDIGVTSEGRERIRNVLLTSRHSVNVHLFSLIRDLVVDRLQDSWLNYLKQDLKTFLEHRLKDQLGHLYLIEDFEVTTDEIGQWLMVRHRPPIPPSRESSELITDEERIRRMRNRQLYLERRAIMERERRKAINAARKRQREIRNALLQEAAEARDVDNTVDVASTIEKPTFAGCQSNRRIMSAFRNHVAAAESQDLQNIFNLFNDIDLYMNYGDGFLNRPKKEMHAININKMYLQPASKRRVQLTPAITSRLKTEKERPKSPTLKDIRSHLLPIVESSFNDFVNLHVQQVSSESRTAAGNSSSGKSRGQSTSSLRSKMAAQTKEAFEAALLQSIITRPTPTLTIPGLSSNPSGMPGLMIRDRHALSQSNAFAQKKLTLRSPNGRLPPLRSHPEGSPAGDWKPDWYSRFPQGSDQPDSTPGQIQKPGKKNLAPAKITPTKDDRAQFLLALAQAAAGKLPTHMWLYYEYLVQHGEEEGNTRLDRDLFFYCEVFKFKEASHAFADEELLKRKVQSISDCYVDSVSVAKEDKTTKESSSTQIDASSEILQKTAKAVQKYVSGKDVSSAIFDDAQNSVFKELLPYWVGFMRNYTPTQEDRPIPLTKKMKERRRKLEEILSWKPPSTNAIVLPNLPDGSVVASFTFTLNDGFRWKEGRANDDDSIAGRRSNLEELLGAGASTSNIASRKMSVISHSTAGDYRSVALASTVSS